METKGFLSSCTNAPLEQEEAGTPNSETPSFAEARVMREDDANKAEHESDASAVLPAARRCDANNTAPPYTAGSLPCYICGSTAIGNTWYALLRHTTTSELEGCWLLEEGRRQEYTNQHARRATRRADAAAESTAATTPAPCPTVGSLLRSSRRCRSY